MSLSTPVSFFIFNRPDTTQKVFQAIRQVKPEKLLVVADGPRPDRSADIEKCAATRAVIAGIDWDCEVLTKFSEQNLGCGKRVSSGLDWVFSQVEEAIVLEDDTLPDLTFFSYCQELLERYRYDERIMHINGDNSLAQNKNPYSYFFSKYMHCWGWASWRRAWEKYDYHMKSWREFKESGMFALACDSPYEQRYWAEIWNQMTVDPQSVDTWDYQWSYACISNGGLCITPNFNLVSNIGFNRGDSTHTSSNAVRANLSTYSIQKLHHPPFIIRDREADAFTFDEIFYGKQLKARDTPIGKLKQVFSPIKQKFLSLQAH